MIPNTNGKSESAENPDIARMIELELINRRAALQQKSGRYRSMRTLTWLAFAALVVGLGALLFFGFSRLSQHRAEKKIHLVTPNR